MKMKCLHNNYKVNRMVVKISLEQALEVEWDNPSMMEPESDKQIHSRRIS